MPHTLPYAAHGDTLPIVKISPKYEGRGEARHIVGTEVTAPLPFDNMALAPITIPGLDAATLPTPETVTERNMKLDLLIGKFQGLVIEYSGGDYGSIRYKGRATGVTFTNLTPAAPSTPAPKS